MPRLPVYCYACRGNVRGAWCEHASTRRHRDSTRPRATRGGTAPYSSRRTALALAYAACGERAANMAAEREYQEYLADGRPDLASWIAGRYSA